jgi:DNA modification methylase
MTLYNADCLDIMREMPDKSVDLVITDPPYGIGEAAGKNIHRGGPAFKNIGGSKNYVGSRDYGNLDWDNKPASKKHITELRRISHHQIIFGGNFFNLPPSSCWIVWDKDNGNNDFADCELAWTSFDTAVRKIKWRWNGLLQEDMAHKEIRIHPTQKPVKLFEWIIKNYAKEGDIICDPFFGSGSCLVAAVRLGHPIIGVEKERTYFTKGKARIEAAQKQNKLHQWGVVA